MDENTLRELFTSNGRVLKDRSRREVDLAKFGSKCYDYNIVINKEDLSNKYKEAVILLYSKEEEENPYDFVRSKISSEVLFKDFVIKGDGAKASLIYYNKGGESYLLGNAADIDARVFKEISTAFIYHELLSEWKELLKPYSKLLKININNVQELISTIWENLYTPSLDMNKIVVDFSAPPVILEGFGIGCDITYPFKRKKVSLEDLHPIKADFLKRMENHKYFCAIIASRLIGHKKPYIPWLSGPGGEGKTTFFEFLKQAFPRHYSSVDMSSDYPNVTEAIGKTFIMIPDTSKKGIFHNDIIKNISGSDPVSLNEKYRKPITLVLPGLIIISSNKLPYIGKYVYARRRARVFIIKAGDFAETSRELSTQAAAKLMMTTKDEFFNYCIQCLEELGSLETGFVSAPISLNTNEAMTPEEYSFEDFMEEKNLVFKVGGEIGGKYLRGLLLKEKRDRGEYFQQNFLDHITEHCGVKAIDTKYVGICEKLFKAEQPKIAEVKELDKDIQELMPAEKKLK